MSLIERFIPVLWWIGDVIMPTRLTMLCKPCGHCELLKVISEECLIYYLFKFIHMEKENKLETKRTRCEIWTRVMGYHRPVSDYNIGKKGEHYSRKHFNEDRCKEEKCAVANTNFLLKFGSHKK